MVLRRSAAMADSLVPVFPPRPGPGDFFRGLKLPFAAIGVVRRSATLKKLTLLSAGVTFVTLSVVIYFVVKYADDLVNLVFRKPETWYGSFGWHLLVALTGLVLGFIGANTLP